MKKSLQQIASEDEKKKYVFETEQDYEILDLIHKVEKKKLSVEDKDLIELLNKLLRKYKS